MTRTTPPLPSPARAGARFLSALALACIGCGGAPPRDAVPTITADPRVARETRVADPPPEGPLPATVVPLHYRLALEVVPSRDRFSGEVRIRARLAEPTRRIWIHGARMEVSRATIRWRDDDDASVTELAARWEPSARDEVAALRTDAEIPAGEIEIQIAYSAPFDRQLKGLYRVDVGEDRYAFTQFEATSARYAFPSFDEPRHKTPFDLELTVPASDRALANTRAIETTPLPGGALQRVRFATTLPLPTYLVAVAVGPLDVVEAAPIPPNGVRRRPLPFRGVAARGRGAELAHALEHTPALVAALEEYFGSEYPYDKLDVIAVPDFASGAMENAGAITFREALLLLGADPPEDQRRAFAGVMAHELAHQWFGNLVTMPWWDDIWLNEAFATWMGTKIVQRVHPEMHADLGLLAAIHGAMGQDSLASARRIRQPIQSDHDIRNAFDSITYSKGGGVLSMFEQWVGEDVFREGIRVYLRQHRFGTATSEDLLRALSEAAGRDVVTPFSSFLDQPGVPLIEARLACDGEGGPRVVIAQSRYTPVGSSAPRDATWSVPVCIAYPTRGTATEVSCELVTEGSAEIALASARGCPGWIMPNAGARGYYRFSLPPEQLRALLDRGWPRLSPAERTSVASDLRAIFASAVLPGGEVLAALPPIAGDPTRIVATDPMGLAGSVIEDIVASEHEARARTWAGSLYRARAQRLGWTPRAGEDGETRLLRRDVLGFMANVARDPRVRAEAARRGRTYLGIGGDGALHPDAVPSDLAGLVASVAVQEGDAATFDATLAQLFATEDAVLRTRLLVALASTEDPALAARALDLALDPRLRVNEVTIPLAVQAERSEGRERAWAWTRERWGALTERIATTRAGATPWIFAGFCDREHRDQVRAFFEPRIAELSGGPRNLAGALEAIDLCSARVAAQRESVERFLAR